VAGDLVGARDGLAVEAGPAFAAVNAGDDNCEKRDERNCDHGSTCENHGDHFGPPFFNEVLGKPRIGQVA
jgi:hypothetical protein